MTFTCEPQTWECVQRKPESIWGLSNRRGGRWVGEEGRPCPGWSGLGESTSVTLVIWFCPLPFIFKILQNKKRIVI